MTDTTIVGQTNGGSGAGVGQSIPLERRSGPRTLLPATWVGRTVRASYMGADGHGVESEGTLLDLYPFGVVMNLEGERAAVAWDALRVVTLVDD